MQHFFTKNTTIRAKWEQNQYTIVYNLGNGTSSSCKSSSPKGGSTYSFKTCAANTVNYTFNRLTGFRGSDGRTYNPGATVNLTSSNSSITLTAQYTEQHYTITCKEIYNANPDGQPIASTQCSLSFSPALSGGAIYINGAKSSGTWGSRNVGKGTWQICVNNGQQCTNNVTVNYSA